LNKSSKAFAEVDIDSDNTRLEALLAEYFLLMDGLHPILVGRELLGYKILFLIVILLFLT